jgi:hypothetical protein
MCGESPFVTLKIKVSYDTVNISTGIDGEETVWYSLRSYKSGALNGPAAVGGSNRCDGITL